MKTSTFAMAFLLAFSPLAGMPLAAKTVSLTAQQSKLSFSIPDSWESATVKRGLEIKSNDGEVMLWVESYPQADLEKVKSEHGKYFQAQGVNITGEPKITTQSAERYGLAFMDMPATWKGKPTVLRYILIEPSNAAKNRMMISYWASPEGDKAHDSAMQQLINSLSQAVDKAM
jgi:hypothetical protein